MECYILLARIREAQPLGSTGWFALWKGSTLAEGEEAYKVIPLDHPVQVKALYAWNWDKGAKLVSYAPEELRPTVSAPELAGEAERAEIRAALFHALENHWAQWLMRKAGVAQRWPQWTAQAHTFNLAPTWEFNRDSI